VLEDHDVATDAVVGSGLEFRVDVEGDDVAHGQGDSLGGRQVGPGLANELERPAGDKGLLASVLVHRDDGAVALNHDHLNHKNVLKLKIHKK